MVRMREYVHQQELMTENTENTEAFLSTLPGLPPKFFYVIKKQASFLFKPLCSFVC